MRLPPRTRRLPPEASSLQSRRSRQSLKMGRLGAGPSAPGPARAFPSARLAQPHSATFARRSRRPSSH
jgi:hypothetical protein